MQDKKQITEQKTIEPSSLVRVQEVAALLDVSVRTVWRKSTEGALPRPISIGRSKRWRRREIEAFVAAAST
jgi:excisionase family DNA binding protein